MDTKTKQQITESLQTGMHLGQLLCAELLADRQFTAEELHGRFMQVSQPIAVAQAMADTLLPAPVVELPEEEPEPVSEPAPIEHHEPAVDMASAATGGTPEAQ